MDRDGPIIYLSISSVLSLSLDLNALPSITLFIIFLSVNTSHIPGKLVFNFPHHLGCSSSLYEPLTLNLLQWFCVHNTILPGCKLYTELLRIIARMMICIQHCLGFGHFNIWNSNMRPSKLFMVTNLVSLKVSSTFTTRLMIYLNCPLLKATLFSKLV